MMRTVQFGDAPQRPPAKLAGVYEIPPDHKYRGHGRFLLVFSGPDTGYTNWTVLILHCAPGSRSETMMYLAPDDLGAIARYHLEKYGVEFNLARLARRRGEIRFGGGYFIYRDDAPPSSRILEHSEAGPFTETMP